MNIKRILILSMLFSPFLLSAQDRTFEFTISCKILDSSILSVEDGISKRYQYYTDGYKIGDYMRLNFEQDYWDSLGAYNLYINDKKRIFDSVASEDFSRLGDMLHYNNATSEITLTNNYISIQGGGNTYSATRYYKDDWQAVYSHTSDNSVHIMSLNCLGVTSRFHSLIKRLEDFHPN